jgi:hypothetical protein
MYISNYSHDLVWVTWTRLAVEFFSNFALFMSKKQDFTFKTKKNENLEGSFKSYYFFKIEHGIQS